LFYDNKKFVIIKDDNKKFVVVVVVCFL